MHAKFNYKLVLRGKTLRGIEFARCTCMYSNYIHVLKGTVA
jgi:hypothetical protein